MLKILKWVVIGFVVLVVLAAIFGDDPAVTSNSSSSTSTPVEPYITTSRQLFAEYEENEVATDMRINKRPVEIRGIVQEIAKDFTDSVVINLRTSNEYMPTRLSLDDGFESVAANMKKGQEVVFVCKRMALIIGSPAGSDCKPK